MHEKRKRIWIDQLQTYLLWRIALYCVAYYLVAWLLVIGWLRVRESLDANFGPTLSASVVPLASLFLIMMAILFIIDALKLTHRIVGPLYRFRQIIKAVNAGEEVALVTLRKDDLLTEMRDELNEMLKSLEARGAISLKAQTVPAAAGQEASRVAVGKNVAATSG